MPFKLEFSSKELSSIGLSFYIIFIGVFTPNMFIDGLESKEIGNHVII